MFSAEFKQELTRSRPNTIKASCPFAVLHCVQHKEGLITPEAEADVSQY